MNTKIEAQSILNVPSEDIIKIQTGMRGFDNLIGGGLVPGTITLFAGARGSGKSTLLMQIANLLTQNNKLLYVSGEESLKQLKHRAERLDAETENLFCTENKTIEDIITIIKTLEPRFLIVDSLQMLISRESKTIPGGPTQTRICLNKLVEITREMNIATIVISHMNKSGDFSGLSTLQHIVDVLLTMENNGDGVRTMKTDKNRYGSTDKIWNIIMTENGFREIDKSVTIHYAGKQEVIQKKEFHQKFREDEVSLKEIRTAARLSSWRYFFLKKIIEPFLINMIYQNQARKVKSYKIIFTLEQ